MILAVSIIMLTVVYTTTYSVVDKNYTNKQYSDWWGLTADSINCSLILDSRKQNWLEDLLLHLSPLFIQIMDLFGTMAFAVTGAFKAIEHKADIVGVIILSTITGIAGGVVWDIIFGIFPPTAIINPSYVIVTVASGIIIFCLYPSLMTHIILLYIGEVVWLLRLGIIIKSKSVEDTICDYINSMKHEVNSSESYQKDVGRLLIRFSRFFPNKSFKMISRVDMLAFLDNYRKPSDPLHKWTGTYNITLVHLTRFFRWLYYPDIYPSKDRPKPPVVKNIPNSWNIVLIPGNAAIMQCHEIQHVGHTNC